MCGCLRVIWICIYAYIYNRHVSLSLSALPSHRHAYLILFWFYFDLFDTLWCRVEHWPITFWCFLWLSDCRGRFRHKGAGREDHIIRFSVYEEKKQDPNISLYIQIIPNTCARKKLEMRKLQAQIWKPLIKRRSQCVLIIMRTSKLHKSNRREFSCQLQTNTGIISCQANLAWLFQGHKYYPFHLVVSRVL